MHVVRPKEMVRVEKKAFLAGASEEMCMLAAGAGVAEIAREFIHARGLEKQVVLLSGLGNNAGDAYAAGVQLLDEGFSVQAIQLGRVEECSFLCQKQMERFLEKKGVFHLFSDLESFSPPAPGVLIDGVFGTGFHGQVEPPFSEALDFASLLGLPILSIDIPSGVHGETGEVQGSAITADETICIGLPKTGLFLQEGPRHTGDIHVVPLPIPQDFIEQAESSFEMLDEEELYSLVPKLNRDQHKYEAGLVVALVGSPGMPGAAQLTCLAALKTGSGLVHLLHPEGMEAELAATAYEVIRVPYKASDPSHVLEAFSKANAACLGPGIGRKPETAKLFSHLLSHLACPLLIDGDGLTLLAEGGLKPPQGAVLTPHLGEMTRLLGKREKPTRNFALLSECQEYAQKFEITLVLKGMPTFIFSPDGSIYANITGDPGMATAGSGDVLSGMISTFLAKGMDPTDAAGLGVYMHGLAGTAAGAIHTSHSVIASDIISCIGRAYAFFGY